MKIVLLSALGTWYNKIQQEHLAASGNLVIQNQLISYFRHPSFFLGEWGGNIGFGVGSQAEVRALPLTSSGLL